MLMLMLSGLLVKRAVVAGSDASQRADTYRVELNLESEEALLSTRNFLFMVKSPQLLSETSPFPSQSLDLEW